MFVFFLPFCSHKNAILDTKRAKKNIFYLILRSKTQNVHVIENEAFHLKKKKKPTCDCYTISQTGGKYCDFFFPFSHFTSYGVKAASWHIRRHSLRSCQNKWKRLKRRTVRWWTVQAPGVLFSCFIVDWKLFGNWQKTQIVFFFFLSLISLVNERQLFVCNLTPGEKSVKQNPVLVPDSANAFQEVDSAWQLSSR